MEAKKKFDKFKKNFTIENLLCFFIVFCPILDVSSFIFRNMFSTSISISTFVRPIIPLVAITYIFFKDRIKPQIIITSVIYLVYAVCHMYIFHVIKTDCSYGNEIREIQYLINYTFMIMNLFIYIYFFTIKNRENEVKDEDKGKSIEKLKKAILTSLTIYISLMYLALITKTSSFTYMEDQIGYKGWFESGNSIGAIMLLCLFVTLPMTGKKYKLSIRIWSFMVTVLVGAYVTTLLGTRTGLFGFILVIVAYIFFKILVGLLKNKNISKKLILGGLITISAICIFIFAIGSTTIARRKQLSQRENEIYDNMTNAPAHVTGDMVKLVEQIKAESMSEEYMSYDMQQAMIKTYDIANETNISYTNMRQLQYVYHSELVKQQDSIPLLLFGNGYMSHFYELIFEMEVPAFLFNFGVIGFFIYFMPFLAIAIYGIYYIIKKYNMTNIETIMSEIGVCFAIVLSFLSGYTFFNSSTMMIIIALCSITINEIKNIEDEEIKIYNLDK